ncbi:hypothetical protein [Paraglaciecola arctica]|uniref:Lipoprotein n=1 Tax=Paraglaciecola arctica BSs20135 TaxID=493475 RepID=K6YH25_9ALTE|nr:hypothetical protein [Paraglaciecola arctica]GAC17462.1 hypothetical protein GARC_0480 [Paraglaciecola arctica BSs20135]
MLLRFNLIILLLSLWLTACSSKPEFDKAARNQFSTEIHSDGSKRFVLSMAYPTDKPKGGRGGNKRSGKKGEGGERSGKGKGGRGQSGKKRDDKQESLPQNSEYISDDEKREAIIRLLDEKIAETGYCRAGYIELNFSQMPDNTEIIGECVESASDQDKQRWD